MTKHRIAGLRGPLLLLACILNPTVSNGPTFCSVGKRLMTSSRDCRISPYGNESCCSSGSDLPLSYRPPVVSHHCLLAGSRLLIKLDLLSQTCLIEFARHQTAILVSREELDESAVLQPQIADAKLTWTHNDHSSRIWLMLKFLEKNPQPPSDPSEHNGIHTVLQAMSAMSLKAIRLAPSWLSESFQDIPI